jgi:hypothetical protein
MQEVQKKFPTPTLLVAGSFNYSGARGVHRLVAALRGKNAQSIHF